MARPFTKLSAQQLQQTIARKLIPTADLLRDLLTRVGLRPYVVRVVRVKWSGGSRGVGEPFVERETDLLPTPKIADLSTLQDQLTGVGRIESGSLALTQISARFTEEELRGRDADGSPAPDDVEVFYEVEFPRVDGSPGEKRRFSIATPPMYFAGRLQWVIGLVKASEDRARDGSFL